MSFVPYLVAGTAGWLCYRYRYNLLSSYHVYSNEGFNAGLFSLLFPSTMMPIGGMEIISFVQGGKVYHYPIPANADKTLSIGHHLYLVVDGAKIDITPPPGVKLTVSPNNFGVGVELHVERGDQFDVYHDDQVVNWPLEEHVVIEE